jgi:hypothetical protein
MTKLDPILAVKNVNRSAEWYQAIFGCIRKHGGDDFAVLEGENGEVLICLYKWGEHDHPTMKNPTMPSGNGLILYYKTDKLSKIRANLEQINWPVAQEVHVNSNSTKKEFSFYDKDCYYWTVTEYHTYEG